MKNSRHNKRLKKVKTKLEIYATGTCTCEIEVICFICITISLSSSLFLKHTDNLQVGANQMYTVI